MPSVTQRIKQVTQPYGGYLKTKAFVKTEFDDLKVLNENENIHASNIGIAVDYLSRFMLGYPKETAFSISLLGSKMIGKEIVAQQLLSKITGLDDISITSACKLSGFDVCYRSSIMGYKPIELINPNEDTISNIRIMVERSLHFFKSYGPITVSGPTFEGGYADTVSSGDGDFCTKDTIWDFKVSKRHITPSHTLQILMYYILGTHSKHDFFKNIKNLGFFNPRLNVVYLCPVSSISREIIETVELEVLCYGVSRPNPIDTLKKELSHLFVSSDFTIDDVCELTNIPKSKIYKDIDYEKIAAYKKNGKYYITRESLDKYLKREKKIQIARRVLTVLAVVFVLLFLILPK